MRTPGLRHLRRLARRLPAPARRVLRTARRRLTSPSPPAAPTAEGESADPTHLDRVVTMTLAASPMADPVPAPIVLRAPATMYVPRVLSKVGLAAYEPYAVDCFLAMVDLAPPGAVFDVGANVGVYGHLAASYSEREVHLFEPTPEAVEVARAARLRPGARLTVVQAAAGEASGSARLYLSERTDSSNSLNAGFRAHSGFIDVPVERLDDYVERTSAVPGVIKIDTETTEPQVIAGASRTIAEHRPWLMVEVLAGRSEAHLDEVLRPFGYTWYHLNGPGRLSPTDEFVGDSTYQHLMYLALPEPAPDQLWDRMAAWREALAASKVTTALEPRS